MSVNKSNNPNGRLPRRVRVASLLMVFCLLASFAVLHSGRLFSLQWSEEDGFFTHASTGNQIVINTSEAGGNVSGYAGPTPLLIYLTDGRIDSVAALPNNETPAFFNRASALLTSWDGLTVDQAAAKRVDAVSGATRSSQAIVGNLRAGLASVNPQVSAATAPADSQGVSLKYIAALVVALLAAVMPLFVKNKRYRLVQELLNVGVLGFWSGTFLDYAIFIHTFADGLTLTLGSLITLLLFIVAFIYPLAGRSGHYCAWVCPMGSLQELAGRIPLPKLHLSARTVRLLNILRGILWCLLVLSLWTGVLVSWIDYEIFSAFIVESASAVVLSVGAAFVLLSLVMARPFCRFVCPVGTLLRRSECRNIFH